MAQVHNEIRKGWLSESVNRALGRTREGGVERVSETCDVVMNPWGMPEWAYLRGERLAGVRRNVPAGGAATFAGCAFVNPQTSRMLMVLEAVSATNSTGAGNVELYNVLDVDLPVPYGSSQQGFVRDSRWPTLTSTGLVRYGTPAAIPTAQILEGTYVTAANVISNFTTSLPIVLRPGSGVLVTAVPANNTLLVCFGWRERQAYPGELV